MQSTHPTPPARITTQQKIQLQVERSREQQKVVQLKAIIEAKLKAS